LLWKGVLLQKETNILFKKKK